MNQAKLYLGKMTQLVIMNTGRVCRSATSSDMRYMLKWQSKLSVLRKVYKIVHSARHLKIELPPKGYLQHCRKFYENFKTKSFVFLVP